MPFLGSKWLICPEQICFVKAIDVTSFYLLAIFIEQNCKKNLKVDPEFSRCGIFEAMVHLPQFFMEKIITIIFIYLLAPFTAQNFKKILTGIQRYTIQWHICPNENFYRKHVNNPCSFHSCLSRCQKSKSDINLLMKY